MIEPGYHHQEGWYFFRNENGSVRIRKHRETSPKSPIMHEITIPIPAWASIIAEVSHTGALAETFAKAMEFQQDPKPDAKDPKKDDVL